MNNRSKTTQKKISKKTPLPSKKTKKKIATKKTVKQKKQNSSNIRLIKNNDQINGGLLISFEGSEGSGKSTQISCLAESLEALGNEVIVTREPGGTELGEEVRHLLMHAGEGNEMTPEAELLLFAASRAQLVRKVILPALDANKIILCDRFLDSTTVYQGIGRQISAEPVHVINTFAAGNLVPHLTIIMDIPAEVGLKRIKRRVNDLPDRMESETIDFYKKIREGYLFLAQAIPERFLVVDGTLKREAIETIILDEIKKRFASKA